MWGCDLAGATRGLSYFMPADVSETFLLLSSLGQNTL
jgi:hypothetical protein